MKNATDAAGDMQSALKAQYNRLRQEPITKELLDIVGGAEAPTLDYEPVGLLDLPPGDRGYGASDRVEMPESMATYNDRVETEQTEAGRLPTEEPIGTRMRWGAWSEPTDRPTPEANE